MVANVLNIQSSIEKFIENDLNGKCVRHVVYAYPPLGKFYEKQKSNHQ